MIIIIRLLGGVGNQMFQYALGRVLSLALNRQLFIETSLLEAAKSTPGFTARNFDLDMFDIRLDLLNIEKHIKVDDKIYSITEKSFEYDENLFELVKTIDHPVMLSGHWQSYKYLELFNKTIKKDFKLNLKLTEHWLELSRLISSTESVMINVRRTDYLLKQDYHGVVTNQYLTAAINIIKTKITNPYFFIFSDDITWCKENIPLSSNIFFVDNKYYDEKYQRYLQLMCSCNHFILSNSSFAWWSAYLGSGKKSIVIAPKEWFTVDINTRDLTPKSWIRLSMY